MEPDNAEDIRNAIDAGVGMLNVFAIQHYAAMLVRCGVKHVRVYREFFLP